MLKASAYLQLLYSRWIHRFPCFFSSAFFSSFSCLQTKLMFHADSHTSSLFHWTPTSHHTYNLSPSSRKTKMAQTITKSFLILVLSFCRFVTASNVAVYKDAQCKTIASTLTASNGYPDGLCTTIAEQTTHDFQSFQFLSLNSGCAGKW